MNDLIECITCYNCCCRNHCDQAQIDYCYAMKYIRINKGINEWLSNFDTSSATKCFEAIQILKERCGDDGLR